MRRNVNIFNIRKKKNRRIYINSGNKGICSISYTKGERISLESINFMKHISKYIGQTITIYTTSGGTSGLGYTGVLLSVNNDFIRIITQPGPAPSFFPGSCCSTGLENDIQNQKNINNLGTIADIPVKSISAFVHNAVGSNFG